MAKSAEIPDNLKKRIQEIPEKPGVYLFKDREGAPLYIGKALVLRKRVGDHFRHYGQQHSKEGILLSLTRRIDFIETPTEEEALLLEASLVKEALPKYNKMLRDDKSFPYLKITAEAWPRLLVVRGRKADGGKYYGPYTSAHLLRQAVKLLRRQFPMRTCRVFPKKVCLMYHLGQCGGPCEGIQGKDSYLETVAELDRFLQGKRDAMVRSLLRRMKEHADNQEYETAKALRDAATALSSVPVAQKRGKPAEEILKDFQDIFSLHKTPWRIECFDISNIQGSQAVGSMVVFVGGEPARSEYRRFRIRTVDGIDDYRMMREVVGRRYASANQTDLPDLVLIDGGKGHLAAAKNQLDSIGLEKLPILSIAKQHELLFAPGRSNPYVLPPNSPALQLLRHLRDEAHRFAITYHRKLHRKEALVSALDGIPGIGEKTAKKILKKAGSLAKIKTMKAEDVSSMCAVPLALAVRIVRELNRKGDVS